MVRPLCSSVAFKDASVCLSAGSIRRRMMLFFYERWGGRGAAAEMHAADPSCVGLPVRHRHSAGRGESLADICMPSFISPTPKRSSINIHLYREIGW